MKTTLAEIYAFFKPLQETCTSSSLDAQGNFVSVTVGWANSPIMQEYTIENGKVVQHSYYNGYGEIPPP